MTKLQIITFPRCGHHWLMNMTQRALDLPCNWHCDLHNSQPHHETLVTKTHDFDLKFEPTPNVPSLVQWRDPIEAICSWYELGIKHGEWESSAQHFRLWAVSRIIFAAQFYRKWIASNRFEVLGYSQIRSNPRGAVVDVAEFMDRQVPGDWQPKPAKAAREVDGFEFYDRDFFEILNDLFNELTQ